MNARELADEMDNSEPTYTFMGLASNMLRQQGNLIAQLESENQVQEIKIEQQADRIAELEKTSTPAKTKEYIESLKKGLADYATTLYETKMAAQEVNTRKNKRIAELEKFIKAILKKGGCDGNICKRYDTHPVKQLTDEEIEAIYEKVYEERHDNQVVAFARAIIKEITE